MSSAPGDPAEPAPQLVQQRELSPTELAAQQGVPARGASHYAKGTAANMMRSMAVIVALSLGIYFITGSGAVNERDSLDVAGTAQVRADQADLPLSYLKELPKGWTATSVRYDKSTAEVMTWNVGYTTSDEEYVSIRQAVDPGKAWLAAQTRKGTVTGDFTSTDGRSWTTVEQSSQDQRSLVHQGAKGELTTVVTGTGSWKQLRALADALVTVDLGATGQ